MAHPNDIIYPDSETCQNVRQFWLADTVAGPHAPSHSLLVRWFGLSSPEEKSKFDAACNTAFATYLESLKPTNYERQLPTTYQEECDQAKSIAEPFLRMITSTSTEHNASNALGLILLLDQIPRNIYRREQKLVYCHFDILCRSVLRAMLSKEPRPDLHPNVRYSPQHRMWFYLPLMHSEYLQDHDTFNELFTAMRKEIEPLADDVTRKFFQDFDLFERKHSDYLERFGRYPYRNIHIGRTTTEEEQAFLNSGGDTFGTG